jgi:hypothetical protein
MVEIEVGQYPLNAEFVVDESIFLFNFFMLSTTKAHYRERKEIN